MWCLLPSSIFYKAVQLPQVDTQADLRGGKRGHCPPKLTFCPPCHKGTTISFTESLTKFYCFYPITLGSKLPLPPHSGSPRSAHGWIFQYIPRITFLLYPNYCSCLCSQEDFGFNGMSHWWGLVAGQSWLKESPSDEFKLFIYKRVICIFVVWCTVT